MAIFSNMIDVSATNAYIIHTEINPSYYKESQRLIRRRLFIKELAMALVTPHIENRKGLPQKPNAAQLVKQIRSNSEPSTSKTLENPLSPVCGRKRGRCHICIYDIKANKHASKCDVCKKFVCQSHHTKNIICKSCES